jgi:RNA polymerase sigma-70 factor, ECF subfamily
MSTLQSKAPLALVVGQDRRTATDGDVARALATGQEWAAIETWRRFAPMVLTLAKRTLGSASEAEDIGQEVFQRVYRNARSLREPDAIRSFVYTCALRSLQNELHRRKMRSWLFLAPPEILDLHPGETLDVEARDLLRKFYASLDELAARDRMVFILRRGGAMTVGAIAAAMQISESTVKRSLARASTRLSRALEDAPRLAAGERWEP